MVRLSGVLDETFQRDTFAADLAGIVVFDMDGVRRITSFGVREWVMALRSLKVEWYGFVRVRPMVVAQFNMVTGFAGRGQVVTLYSPHVCTKCGKDVEILVDLRRDPGGAAASALPVVMCPDCASPAEFDDIPESYFAYVAAAPHPILPPEAEPLIDQAAEVTSSMPWRVTKEVDGTVTALWASGVLDSKAHFKRLVDGLEGDVVMILGDVTGVTPEGVAKLWRLADTEGLRLALARIPISLAEYLLVATTPRNVRLLSFSLAHTCKAGHREMCELDGTDLSLLDLLPTPRTCSSCLLPLKLDLSPAFLSGLTKLPLGGAPGNVRAYLALHPKAPEAAPPEARQPPPVVPGEESWGKYKLVRRIGSGGMAEVYLARQLGPEGFEKKVVLKRLLEHISSNQEVVDLFLQEARVAAKLSHPNVVQIFDLGKVDDQYYIAMEFVNGWDLNAILRGCRTAGEWMPAEIACRIMSDVCAGLSAAHRPLDDEGNTLGLIHRDISPHNILLANNGSVKLTDFGIVKASGSLNKTAPGTIRGKLAYMSPEQIHASADLDGRSDLFSVGIVLYHCLTLQQPFRRDTDAETLFAVVKEPAPSIVEARPDLPQAFDPVLKRALAKERDLRYQTADEFRLKLEHLGTASTTELSNWLAHIVKKAEFKGAELSSSAVTPTTLPALPHDSVPSKGKTVPLFRK